MDYHIVSQGKTTIPSVDDGEEMTLTDVRINFIEPNKLACALQRLCLEAAATIKLLSPSKLTCP